MKPRPQKKQPKPDEGQKTVWLSLQGAGFSIRANWKAKDAALFIRAFSDQALRQS